MDWSHVCARPTRLVLAGLRDRQRAGAPLAAVLVLAAPPKPRISAAKARSLADNFLQKQRKQRKYRIAKGRRSNPIRSPRGSRDPSARAARQTSLSPNSGGWFT